jgi:DNA adenine methylase
MSQTAILQPILPSSPSFKVVEDAAGPFLKWAGGKSQLLPVINQHYPQELLNGDIKTYIEPFVGGGAVFFDIQNRFSPQHSVLIDTNPDLVLTYQVIQQDVHGLIRALAAMEATYHAAAPEEQQAMFYAVREEFNAPHTATASNQSGLNRAAQNIFLNRTCFNGLFRVNSKGKFNVPFGQHKKPTILFEKKLRAAAKALQKAEVIYGDFTQTPNLVKPKTFVYYDPPYRPISLTSHFKAYSKEAFNDDTQRQLATMFREIDQRGVKQMLSNSDPTNHGPDPFFDDLYQGFTITRVDATRFINAKGTGRGVVRELLIKNYD